MTKADLKRYRARIFTGSINSLAGDTPDKIVDIVEALCREVERLRGWRK